MLYLSNSESRSGYQIVAEWTNEYRFPSTFGKFKGILVERFFKNNGLLVSRTFFIVLLALLDSEWWKVVHLIPTKPNGKVEFEFGQNKVVRENRKTGKEG